MRPRSLCPSSLVAVLLLLVLVRLPADDEPTPTRSAAVASPAPRALLPADATCADAQAEVDPRIVGLWHRWDAFNEGDPLRFYFFHPDGFGLYRYGKVGLTNTHSFDYSAADGGLRLRFRKTGVEHAPRYRFEVEGGRTWLVVRGDPREGGAEVRYSRAADPFAQCEHGALDLRAARPADGAEDLATDARVGGRMWGEEQRYATGGMGFSIYQLQPQAIDGRGVGWHHRGDYDEWTTETLTYRQQGDRLALGFPLRHDGQVTAISVDADEHAQRWLTLFEDPRDFWRAHTYRDLGPSWAACP